MSVRGPDGAGAPEVMGGTCAAHGALAAAGASGRTRPEGVHS